MTQSRLKLHVPESMSQLIPNQGKTGANGGPKWRQIWTFSKLITKMHFIQIEMFFAEVHWVIFRTRWGNKRIWCYGHVKGGHQTNWLGVRTIMTTWCDYREKCFSYKEFQFKTFCLTVRTSFPSAENINETPGIHRLNIIHRLKNYIL